MIIGAFTTTAHEVFFGEEDIDAFLTDIRNIDTHVIVKEKRGGYPNSRYPSVRYILSVSDIVIGCPFTSVVIEALSSGIPAFWYDPLNKCPGSDLHDTPFLYVRKKGLVKGIIEWYHQSKQEVKSISIKYGTIIDPYSDGKAKERFRELILK